MILRQVLQLRAGDVIILKHPRYKSSNEFEVLCTTIVCTEGNSEISFLRVKTLAKDTEYGPQIDFRLNDVVQVTPE